MTRRSINSAQKMLVSLLGVMGTISIAFPALSQQQRIDSIDSTPNHSVNQPNRINTNTSSFDGRVQGGNRNYPYGSKVFDNGTISTPNRGSVYPSSTIRHGDGTTSYYYRDGSRITVDPTKISPSGTPIRK